MKHFSEELREVSRSFSTLVELLHWRSSQQGDAIGYSFLDESGERAESLTYGELERKAFLIASELRSRNAGGQRVLLLYPPGLEFIASFFGCLYAGAIAVPAYPIKSNRSQIRLAAIAADADAHIALTASQIIDKQASQAAEAFGLKQLQWIATDTLKTADNHREELAPTHSLAFIQYTSGSTGKPKGVVLSHSNLLANAALVHRAVEHSETDRYVSWLPMFHDMGFMAGVLQPLFAGIEAVLMSPVSFIQQPLRWLRAISRYHGTTSGGPNFAYDLCVRQVKEEEKNELDLSCWTVAFNGAEPVRAQTLERFAEKFQSCGFRRQTFFPCYGLAEATLMVSGGHKHLPPFLKNVSARALEQNSIADPDPGETAWTLVGCGETLPPQKIAIVDPETLRVAPAGRVGEIWVTGASVGQAYWEQPQESKSTFRAGLAEFPGCSFLRTGDLGFLHENQLFITGRLKDLLIIRGLNYYPQDVETTTERVCRDFNPGTAAAFAVNVSGEERLVVLQEVERSRKLDVESLLKEMRSAIAEEHGLAAHAIFLVRRGKVPRTSSGKVQRHVCRTDFLEGTIEAIGEWWEALPVVEAEPEKQSAGSATEIEAWLALKLAQKAGIPAHEVLPERQIVQLGIDSLMAAEIAYAIEKEFGVELNFAALLDGCTVADTAAQIYALTRLSRAAEGLEVSPAPEFYSQCMLTHGQRALWFLQQLVPGSVVYNIFGCTRIHGEVNQVALHRALDALMDRHPSLRTTFAEGPEGPRQIVAERMEADFAVEDSSLLDSGELLQQIHETAHKPFVLDRGPLLRMRLFRISAREYVLLLAAHHLIMDFHSFEILVDELFHLYTNPEVPLRPLSLRYADYVNWQAGVIASPEMHSMAEEWKKEFTDAPLLDLPVRHARPVSPVSECGSVQFHLSAESGRQLEARSREYGVTPFMIALGAFQLLLQRYTQQPDFVVGTVASGRTRPELAELVGYFANLVPLRTQLPAVQKLSNFLGQVSRVVTTGLERQKCPFPLLIEKLGPRRESTQIPLVQALFTMHKENLLPSGSLAAGAVGYAGLRTEVGGLVLESMRQEPQETDFDVSLNLAILPQALAGVLHYRKDLLAKSTAESMVRHYQALLEQMLSAAPGALLSELSLLTGQEREQLLVEWNQTKQDYPASCMQELFEQQVERSPEAAAVVWEEHEMSYAELNRRANQMAHYLRQQGVGPEVLVGICMERGLEMLVGLLGVMKAGGAYVPLDPEYPAERLAYMLEDSGAPVLLTQEKLKMRLPEYRGVVIAVDTQWEQIAVESSANLERTAGPDTLIYVIYTSGSTGKPKGVGIMHGNVVNFCTAMDSFVPETARKHWLAVTSISFDISFFELLWTLARGFCVELAEPRKLLDSRQEQGEKKSAQAPTHLQFTPSTASMFMEGAATKELLRSVQNLFLAGEMLPVSTVEELRTVTSARICNMYGPTETTIFSSVYELPEHLNSSVPIGKPIANTEIYILDAELAPVPVGLGGELYIGGAGVARGYLNKPEATAERFIAHPFSQAGGERLYRTGDMARYQEDGNIEYLGRVDHQVKVRGHRIELGEIEAVLAERVEVRQCVVVAQGTTAWEKQLVGYVVTDGGEIDSAGLRNYLQQRLPAHMVPGSIVRLAALPLTPNGKVDRKRLPAPEEHKQKAIHEYAGPRTQIEEVLCGIWAEVLSLEQVGIHDNFFELGGHSLLATKMIALARRALGIELPLQQVFNSPTVASLAADVQKHDQAAMPDIRPVSRQGELPLSFAQQRLWFLQQLEPHNLAYQVPVAVRLKGHLDCRRLEQSLEDVIRRHEVLRTIFPAVDGRAVQVVQEPQAFTLKIVDLSGLDELEKPEELRQLIHAESAREFQLATGPLVRGSLFRIKADEHVLLVVMHHITTDGWSMGVLLQDIAAVYDARTRGAMAQLPELPVQYADYAAWQRNLLQGPVLTRQMEYWKSRLQDVPVLELPTDFPRPAQPRYEGSSEATLLPAALNEKLKRASRQHDVTLFMTLLAAFQLLLSRYAGEKDIAIGTPVAHRTHADLKDLIGFFVNTLVLRNDLRGELLVGELLKQVRETAIGAYTHQDVPFEKLVDELHPERNLNYSPLFQVMFVLQNTPLPAMKIGDLELDRIQTDIDAVKFDLTLMVAENSTHDLTMSLEYRNDLFKPDTMRRMLEHLKNLLQDLAEGGAERRISELSLLSGEEREQVVRGWNGASRREYELRGSLQQRFEEQAERCPEAVALRHKGCTMSYGELEQKSNQVARYLRKRGVGAEERVGICLERGMEMIVAMLGVLKAGGVYVPLDPGYPEERLRYMAEDSEARVVLAQRGVRERLGSAGELGGAGVEVVCWEEVEQEIGRETVERLERVSGGENAAYVIYTSGSTGKPKGTVIRHTSAVTLVEWAGEEYGAEELAGVLAGTSMCFDLSVYEIFVPLSWGGAVVIAENVLELPWLEEKDQVRLINTVPSAMKELVRMGGVPEGVRTVNLAGEALKRELVEEIYGKTPVERVVNLYGPTEDTTYSTYAEMKRGEKGAVEIGRPVANTQVYLVDERMEPVGVGLVGEIYLGGAGLGRGYWRRGELTAERYVANPFSETGGERLYRTGDLGRYREDGGIECLGRKDEQVKVRGYRIELGEIERVLEEHGEVREAVVVVREQGGEGEKQLVAYVVGEGEKGEKGEKEWSGEKLREYLRGRLPEALVPGVYVEISELPLTPNGKVDRKRLPAPEEHRQRAVEVGYTGPRTEVEEVMCGIWAEVLGLERVGIHDNFFELGGDSILSIQIVARANQAGLAVMPRQMFDHQTVASLATVADRLGRTEAEQGTVTGAVPLTPIQHWFFEQETAEPHYFNQAVLLDVIETVEPMLMEEAIAAVLRQHDALRTRFFQQDGQWQQEIAANEAVGRVFAQVDLSECEEKLQREKLIQAANEWHASFNLQYGPLLRCVLFNLGAGHPQKLLLTIHHLVVDGVSWRILLQDLERAIAQLKSGKKIELGKKTSSYQQWAMRLLGYAQSERVRAELEYWRHVPRQVSHLDGSRNSPAEEAEVVVSLTPELTSLLLHSTVRAYSMQVQEVLLAALACTFMQITDDKGLLLDLEAHGREEISAEIDVTRTVGWFTTMFPVYLGFQGGADPGTLLKNVKETVRDIPERGIGYGLLRYLSEAADQKEQLASQRRPAVRFNYLGQLDHVLGAEGLFRRSTEPVGKVLSALAAASHALDINAYVERGQLQIFWSHASHYSRTEVEAIASRFVGNLARLIAYCQSPEVGSYTPSDFPLAKLTQETLDELSAAGTEIENIYPATPGQEGVLFHTLFTPEAALYVEQMSCRLHGELNIDAFKRAWQQLVDRHWALRSSFVWRGLESPVQVVAKSARINVQEEDWRGMAEEAQAARLREFLAADRMRKFDLHQAPLMRVTVIRLGDHDWQMVWTHHHLLLDGWSWSIVVHEFFVLYEAYMAGLELHLDLPGEYNAYWRWLRQQDRKQAQGFWHKQLEGFTAPTELGIEKAEHEQGHAQPEVIQGSLQERTTQQLEKFCRSQRVTLSTVIQGAWSVLLSRYSGLQEILFGATASGRPGEVAGIEKLVGMLIHSLPLRVKVRRQDSFMALLKQTQEQQVEQRQYEHIGLAYIQACCELEPGTPLFKTLVAVENYPVAALTKHMSIGSLEITNLLLHEHANYACSLIAVPGPSLSFRLLYDGNRYGLNSMERMLGHLKNLLEQIGEGGVEQRVSELSLLGSEEREQLLVEWNQTKQEYPANCVQAMFEEQVRLRPEALAVACGEQELSYGELNRRANQVAHYLKKKGVGPEVVVGICMEPGVDMVVGILGAVKAGGAYLALDAEYPGERLGYMVEDSGAKVVLVDGKSLQKLEQPRSEGRGRGELVCLEKEWEKIGSEREENPGMEVEGENLAYVIYTSGSTGKPKGVMLRQSGLVNLVEWHVGKYGVSEQDRATQVAGTGFDASVWEVWPYLTRGASLWVAEGEKRRDAGWLVEWLEEEEISLCFLPTPMAEVVLEQMEEKKRNSGAERNGAERNGAAKNGAEKNGASGGGRRLKLKKLLTGGDKLHRGAKEELGFELVNHYGPTENTVVATCGEVGVGEKRPGIGKPIGNTEVYVLDGEMELVPVGVVGELYVGGASLARGYLGQAELTAEKFVAHSYGAREGERLYRTGDLCRWRESGELEFVGRADQQVKVRGYRIELGEIESVLGQHGSVGQAAVVAREEERGGKRLVGYVVRGNGQPIDGEQLRQYMRELLPEYMVPAVVVEMEELPLTANGKVDRERLPEPVRVEGDDGRGLDAPQTGVEEVLCGIWAEVLGLERVGIHDNFFELGGHSVLAMQTISRMSKALNMKLELRSLFEHPTVAELSKAIEHKEKGISTQHIHPVDREAALPLSFAQQRLWVLDQIAPGNCAYNVHGEICLQGKPNIQALEKSLREIVQRHESLRTVIRVVDGRAVQIIQSGENFSLVRVDLSSYAKAGRELQAERLRRAEARQQFNLANGPLIRALLIQMEEEKYLLELTMHHIVTDGWSIGLFRKEMEALYGAYVQGSSSPLTPLSIQYADYAAWQRGRLQPDMLQEHLQYWKAQLAGVPVLELPTDCPRSSNTNSGDAQQLVLDEQLTSRLKRLGRQQDATLFMTVLAAFQILLSRYSGCQDFAIGTPIANRLLADIEDLIGCFVNTLVLRTNLAGNPRIRELLGRVRENALNAYAHQDLPFEKLVDELQPERDLNYTPLFQVAMVLHSTLRPSVELPGLQMTQIRKAPEAVQFDLTLDITETPEQELAVVLEYRSDLFLPGTIRRMLGHLKNLLEQIAEGGVEQRVGDLCLLGAEEREQLLVEWNRTKQEHWGSSVQAMFEEQARLRPEALAVVCGERELSYGELNRRANQVAHYLKKKGVGPEVVVGICMEPGVEMVMGIVGAVKAGGAYLALDAEYPGERLGYMVKDSGAKVVLVDGRSMQKLEQQKKSEGTGRGELICLEKEWEKIGRESEENPEIEVEGENLAYVIYTSGSTGKPKGVMLRQSGLVNLVEWHVGKYGVSEKDRATQVAGTGFDASVWEVWPYLSRGASLWVAEGEKRRDAGWLVEWLEEEEISLCFLPTPMAEVVLEQMEEKKRKSGAEKNGAARNGASGGGERRLKLKKLLTGGDKLHRGAKEELGFELVNHYGPTENTVVATCGEVGVGEKRPGIGKPIGNTEVYVLDAEMELAPVGVVGELYVGGASLARGYLGQAELTAEKFVAHRHSSRGGERLYRTGDLCRWRETGELEFIGRADQQVKVRGYRIELGEIESVLGQHGSVGQAAVVAREEERGGKRLVGYVVRSNGQPIDGEQLRQYMRERLPEYMVPAVVVEMEELPLTVNGKVDRKKLAELEVKGRGGAGEEEESYVRPRTGVEEELCGIWAEVLGLERVGIHDNFFELGGDSILSIQIVARANRAGLRVTPRKMFEHQTVASLAAAAASQFGETEAEQGTVSGAVPLTPIQHWFFEQELAEPHHFNQAVLLDVRETVEPALMEETIVTVLRQHDALRMRFFQQDGQWRQENGIEEDVKRIFTVIDLTHLPENRQKEQLYEYARQCQGSLNLQSGPLARVVLFITSPARYQLYIAIHHLVVDGVSWRILFEDVERAYRQLQVQRPVDLGRKTISYQHWARHVESLAKSDELQESLDFWLELLSRKIQPLPRKGVLEANTAASAKTVTACLESERTRQLLQEALRPYHMRIQEVLLTALVQTFSDWNGSRAVLVNLEGHGRDKMSGELNLERTVGWFTNIFPAYFELTGTGEPGADLMAIKEQARAVTDRGGTYGLLRYMAPEASVRHKLKSLPRPEVTFNYLGHFDQEIGTDRLFQLTAEDVGSERGPRNLRDGLFEISALILKGELRIIWIYSEDLHDRKIVLKLMKKFMENLQLLVDHCMALGDGSHTPSDFPDVKLNQVELDAILGN